MAQNAASYIVDLATGLKPSGHGGFEDFVRQLYQGWTGRRAYLAGSGLQHGGDAGGVGEDDIADCISCKRYSKSSPSERDVLGEFRQAVLSNPELDLWILAATSPVSRQVGTSLNDSGRQDGVPVLLIMTTLHFPGSFVSLPAKAPSPSHSYPNISKILTPKGSALV